MHLSDCVFADLSGLDRIDRLEWMDVMVVAGGFS